jgi:hypothetical protein
MTGVCNRTPDVTGVHRLECNWDRMGKIAQELLAEARVFLAGFGAPVSKFTAAMSPDPAERNHQAAPLNCLRHLDACAALAEHTSGEAVARLLAERGQRLHWGQTYTSADFGQKFVDNYGWLELTGTRGHFADDTVACGFLVLGPNIHYPDHHHEAEEIYIPLTGGATWRKGEGDLMPRAAGRSFTTRRT